MRKSTERGWRDTQAKGQIWALFSLSASANAYYCRVNATDSGDQFAPAYDDGTWLDSSPSTDLQTCKIQLNTMVGNIYCRVNGTDNGPQFAPAVVGGDWLDSSPSTSLGICLTQLREIAN